MIYILKIILIQFFIKNINKYMKYNKVIIIDTFNKFNKNHEFLLKTGIKSTKDELVVGIINKPFLEPLNTRIKNVKDYIENINIINLNVSYIVVEHNLELIFDDVIEAIILTEEITEIVNEINNKRNKPLILIKPI